MFWNVKICDREMCFIAAVPKIFLKLQFVSIPLFMWGYTARCPLLMNISVPSHIFTASRLTAYESIGIATAS